MAGNFYRILAGKGARCAHEQKHNLINQSAIRLNDAAIMNGMAWRSIRDLMPGNLAILLAISMALMPEMRSKAIAPLPRGVHCAIIV